MPRSEKSILEQAVSEIASSLLSGDWSRHSTEDSSGYYYIIHESDWLEMDRDGRSWNHVTIQPARIRSDFEDWYVRAVLSDKPVDVFGNLRKGLKKAGLPPNVAERLAEAAERAQTEEELRAVISDLFQSDVRMDIGELLAFIEVVRIKGTQSGFYHITNEDRIALRGAFELKFLKELTERFPKVVDRATEFEEWLSFFNPHLREAVRCYLYGFFTASVLVAVAALDARLNEVAQLRGPATYAQLVAAVFGVAGVLEPDPAMASALNDLFDYRNRIAHGGVEATRDEALAGLTLIRSALDRIPARS